MASDTKVVASAVGMLADTAAKNIAAKTGCTVDAADAALRDEVNRIEGQLSIMVSHIEGRYEAEIAKIKGFGFIRRLFS